MMFSRLCLPLKPDVRQGESFLPAACQPDLEGGVVQPGPGGQGPGGGKVIDPA